MSTLNGGPGIVTEGLILYVDAANTYSYPGIGTTWSDISRGGISGIINNSFTTSSINGGIISLTSLASEINFSQSTLQPTALTICAWISQPNIGQSKLVLGKGKINDPAEWGLSFGYSNPLLLVGRTTTFTNQIQAPWTGSLLTGYHHVAYTTVSNTSSAMYIDGALVASTNTVGAIGLDVTSPLKAGRWADFGNGTVAYGNMQLYNRALSATEILQNYTTHKSRFGL
jgi:hypothetical protein